MDNDLSEKIGAILSDPSALAGIMNAVGGLGLVSPALQKSEPPPPIKNEAQTSVSAVGAENGLSDRTKGILQSRALLQALKPYLSEERRARIDKIMNMMKIAELMGYMK